jgi:hypothetical protein
MKRGIKRLVMMDTATTKQDVLEPGKHNFQPQNLFPARQLGSADSGLATILLKTCVLLLFHCHFDPKPAQIPVRKETTDNSR